MSEFVSYSVVDSVGVITINRPPVNALSVGLVEEFASLIGSIGVSDDAHAVVITGGEQHFSAGMDIRELERDVVVDPSIAVRAARRFDQIFQRLSDLKQPAISAVNGYALGGACMLSLYCDIRIGSRSSSYGFPEIALGGLPSFGLQRVTQAVGVSQTKRLVLTGERIDAEEALRLGLIDVLAPAGQAIPEAMGIARTIAKHAIISVQSCKRAIDLSGDVSLDAARRVNFEMAGRIAETADRRESLQAFLEKRPPVLTGK